MLQADGNQQPLDIRFSSVGILECKLLQTIKDLEGGISGDQMSLA